jgi:ABC-type antimicrobial peptide transport system permease subunit
VLSTIAGLLGLGLTLGLAGLLRAVAAGSEALGPLGNFIVTAPVIVQGVFLALFVGMLAGVVPSWGAAHKPVVQTLHEVF